MRRRIRKTATGPKKLLSPAELVKATEDIAQLAAQQQIPVALLGGYALQQYGSDRLTSDVDFAAAAILDDLQLVEPLSFGGYAAKTATGVPVDLIVRDDAYKGLYDEALATAIWLSGVPVPVVQPEYLLAMKMATRRTKDDADVEFLLDVVDPDKAEKIVRQFLGLYAVDELLLLMDELEWLRSRGR